MLMLESRKSGHEQTVRSSLLVYKGAMGKLNQVTAQRDPGDAFES